MHKVYAGKKGSVYIVQRMHQQLSLFPFKAFRQILQFTSFYIYRVRFYEEENEREKQRAALSKELSELALALAPPVCVCVCVRQWIARDEKTKKCLLKRVTSSPPSYPLSKRHTHILSNKILSQKTKFFSSVENLLRSAIILRN